MPPPQKSAKELITCLCSILDHDGVRKLGPETFRLAKFGDSTAEEELLQLLVELLILVKTKTYDSTNLVRQYDSDVLREFSRRELDGLGSPVCCGESSRTLLLNIAWLICEKDILEKIVGEQCSVLSDDSLILSANRDDTREMEIQPPETDDPIAELNSLRWVYGSILAKLKLLKSMTSQKAKLIHRIHQHTEGAGFCRDRRHLTVKEVQLLRDPNQMASFMLKLEKENALLENLLLFKDNEHVFWKWMGTVLDAHQSDLSPCPERSVDKNLFDTKLERLRSSQGELQARISAREDAIEELDICVDRAEESLDPTERDHIRDDTNIRVMKYLRDTKADSFSSTHYANSFSLIGTVQNSPPSFDKNRNHVGVSSPEKVDPYEMYKTIDSLIPEFEKKVQIIESEISDVICQYYDLMS